MNNRERWIVYPLLFYALVMGFKSTYRDPLEFRCRTIECQQLNVRMINGSAALATPPSRFAPHMTVVRPYRQDETAGLGERPGETTTGARPDRLAAGETSTVAELPAGESSAAEPSAGDSQ
jgi:hypothetical protein